MGLLGGPDSRGTAIAFLYFVSVRLFVYQPDTTIPCNYGILNMTPRNPAIYVTLNLNVTLFLSDHKKGQHVRNRNLFRIRAKSYDG